MTIPFTPTLSYSQMSLEFACYMGWMGIPIIVVDQITEALIGLENEENQ